MRNTGTGSGEKAVFNAEICIGPAKYEFCVRKLRVSSYHGRHFVCKTFTA